MADSPLIGRLSRRWASARAGEDARRFLLLTATQVVQLLAAFGLTIFLAKELGPARFGAFSFFLAAMMIVAVFCELGFFTALARLVVHEPDERAQRLLLGGGFALAGVIYVVFALCMVALAFLVEPVWGIPARESFLIAAPLSGGFALEGVVILYLCQGTGRYDLLMVRNLVARPLPLVLLATVFIFAPLSVTTACLLYVVGPTVVAIVVCIALKPDFRGVRRSIGRIRQEARRSGDFGIYIGRAVGGSTYNLDRLLIAYFLSATELSYYALAYAFVTPVTFGAQSLGSVSYPELARSPSIPRRLFVLKAAWLLPAAVCAFVGITLFVELYLESYEPLLDILPPLLAMAVVSGGGQLQNQFLIAHGKGRELRNAGLIYAGANLALKVPLIPAFGLQGAAYSSLAAALVMLGLLHMRYRDARGEPEEDSTLISPLEPAREA